MDLARLMCECTNLRAPPVIGIIVGRSSRLTRLFSISGTRTVARELYKRIRVICCVMTNPGNHTVNARHVKATWGKRCNTLLFMSTVEGERASSTRRPSIAILIKKRLSTDILFFSRRKSTFYCSAGRRWRESPLGKSQRGDQVCPQALWRLRLCAESRRWHVRRFSTCI